MRKHPARRTRTAIAVAAVFSTVGLAGAYALGSTASGFSTSNGNGATASRNSSSTSTYADDGGYDDGSSRAMVVSPSQNVPDTSSRAS